MMELDSVPEGGQVRLDHFKDTLEGAERLKTMGLIEGEPMTVVRNRRRMPIVVRFKDADVMLGRSLCSMIYVSHAEQPGA